jgi:hypothetical protein
MQNTSHAVMAQRSEAKDSLDDFPTPPWATRALVEYVLRSKKALNHQTCLEPACGAGHMSKVLAEYFKAVQSFDIHDYRYGEVKDYLKTPLPVNSFDWVITNPPFRLAEEFALRSLKVARRGVAILARTVFMESVGRYERLFQKDPPSKFAQFTERVPMVKGRLDRKASTATGYCWLVWEKESSGRPEVIWIPPCRKSFERDTDYDLPTPPLPPVEEVAAPVMRRKSRSSKVQESLFGF